MLNKQSIIEPKYQQEEWYNINGCIFAWLNFLFCNSLLFYIKNRKKFRQAKIYPLDVQTSQNNISIYIQTLDYNASFLFKCRKCYIKNYIDFFPNFYCRSFSILLSLVQENLEHLTHKPWYYWRWNTINQSYNTHKLLQTKSNWKNNESIYWKVFKILFMTIRSFNHTEKYNLLQQTQLSNIYLLKFSAHNTWKSTQNNT